MSAFKRIMIGLDFTLIDKTLIEYAAFISKYLDPEKIYFVHVHRHLDVPDKVKKLMPELNQPMDEKLKAEMIELVQENFNNHEHYDIDYMVKEGNAFEGMLHWSEVKNIDLIIAGRKTELKGSGILPQKLARKSRCSVLFVPENVKLNLKNVFVPIDFSENSKKSLQLAIDLVKEVAEEATIYCQHNFALPSGYYTTGKSEEEFTSIMKENAAEDYNEMIKDLETNGAHISPSFILDKHGSPAILVNRSAHQRNADLIIIGAKGKTGAATLLLGSVTEKLISLDKDIPLLVHKQKEKAFNFMDLINSL